MTEPPPPEQPQPGWGTPPPQQPGWGGPPPGPPPAGYGGYPPQQPYPPYGYGGYPGYPQQPGTNGMAIASLVCSLVFFCGLTSVLAIIFGVVAKGQIKRTNQSGDGLATAGIVIGCVGVALMVLWFMYFVSELGSI